MSDAAAGTGSSDDPATILSIKIVKKRIIILQKRISPSTRAMERIFINVRRLSMICSAGRPPMHRAQRPCPVHLPRLWDTPIWRVRIWEHWRLPARSVWQTASGTRTRTACSGATTVSVCWIERVTWSMLLRSWIFRDGTMVRRSICYWM